MKNHDDDFDRTADLWEFAKILHDAGRSAVEAHKILNHGPVPKPFVVWEDLPQDAKDGRFMQAEALLKESSFIGYMMNEWGMTTSLDD